MSMVTIRARRLSAAVAAMVVTLPGVAAADSSSFGDPTETSNPEDITRVSVEHAKKVVIVVKQRKMRGSGADLPAEATIAISTGSKYKGPEFLLEQTFYTEGGPNLRRTKGWDGPKGPLMDNCIADLEFKPGRDQIRYLVPRRCIDKPNAVRVNVKYRFFEPKGKRKVDYAPARRELGPAAHHAHHH